jgi:putative Holliday junction resolvase
MAKILGIDYGQRRMGIAITDEAQSQVFMRPTIESKSFAETMRIIVELCRQEGIARIVIGWPVPLAGGTNVSAELEEFANTLANQTNLPIIRFDERLTSDQAERWLHEQPGRSAPKGRRDQLSAMIILQNYLDSQNK